MGGLACILIEVPWISRISTFPHTRTTTRVCTHTHTHTHTEFSLSKYSVQYSEEDSRFVDSFSWVFSVFSCTAKKKKRRAFLITTSVPISGSSREDPLPHFFRQGKR